ncbi:hypothetical protein HHI36_006052 [Cryptolaemus montrouzieri]|uniref:Uncharacterized protein n=1 Tax=Cryptolaemus montrouzieri TaxID=559131 RepID=A0ABD2NWV9_9CUCU
MPNILHIGRQYLTSHFREEVHQLFLDREEDGDISAISTIDNDHDSEEEYSIDGDVTVETEPDPNDGFDGDAEDAATILVSGEEVHQLFLDREEDGDISAISTIDNDHDSEEEYSIDGDVTVETEPDPNDGFDGDAEDAATILVPGEEVHQLFLDREEDGDISAVSTIDNDHDSEEEYSIDGDVTVETEPDPNDGFDGDAEDAATILVPGNSSDLPSSSASYVYGKKKLLYSVEPEAMILFSI